MLSVCDAKKKMLHAGAFTSGFTEASNSKVVPPQTNIAYRCVAQPSSLWRRMLRYRSMPHNKKPLIMHVNYWEALRRRCCAWSQSMTDGCAAAGTWCFCAFDVSCKLISNLSCVVSTPHRTISIFERLPRQRQRSNNSINRLCSAIDVAGDGYSDMCWKSSSVETQDVRTACASVISPYHICR